LKGSFVALRKEVQNILEIKNNTFTYSIELLFVHLLKIYASSILAVNIYFRVFTFECVFHLFRVYFEIDIKYTYM